MDDRYGWYECYRAALLETDWTKMPERIKAAKSQIHDRQRMFSKDHAVAPEERHAIDLALASLKALQVDSAEWQKNRVTKNDQGLAPA